MFSAVRRLRASPPWLRLGVSQLRFERTQAGQNRRRSKLPSLPLEKADEKSEWWAVDGEMHEIGDHVPPRERFVIARDNIPNRRRKQLREQFMRRTRLVLKESEHEPWCKKYMELYNELRENWERLYWDEGYSKKIARDHANYESAEEDDEDFNPYRSRRPHGDHMKDQGFNKPAQAGNWDKVSQIRDRFEYDRERRMREKAFAPMNAAPTSSDSRDSSWNRQRRPLDTKKYLRD
ncbi:PREDICTED: uncharacterized protein LOC104818995 [Tarenaya hassleriana]|uniref:uncharacterized protein LOC104818995 n=1 Tax=Tarenaya hassleriana TaxID=28532 RepID=UPI00053C1A5F|nr:PREDICTED: uncharacterized protein LOC104818995 [Tarenaya hassleriana]